MTTGQTIASTPPVHIKINSPIPQKILSQNRTHFPKNLSHLDLNRLLPPNLLKARTCYRCYNRDKCDKCDKCDKK